MQVISDAGRPENSPAFVGSEPGRSICSNRKVGEIAIVICIIQIPEKSGHSAQLTVTGRFLFRMIVQSEPGIIQLIRRKTQHTISMRTQIRRRNVIPTVKSNVVLLYHFGIRYTQYSFISDAFRVHNIVSSPPGHIFLPFKIRMKGRFKYLFFLIPHRHRSRSFYP